MYKDLQKERSTPEKNLGVASRSTLEQQSNAVTSDFVELDAPVEKIQSILKGNEESRAEPPNPQIKVRRANSRPKL